MEKQTHYKTKGTDGGEGLMHLHELIGACSSMHRCSFVTSNLEDSRCRLDGVCFIAVFPASV